MHGLMTSPEDFQTQYVKPVAKKLNERTIYHGVIATHKVNRLRNCMLRPDTYVLIHCADSIDKLKAFYDSREYTCTFLDTENPKNMLSNLLLIKSTMSLHFSK